MGSERSEIELRDPSQPLFRGAYRFGSKPRKLVKDELQPAATLRLVCSDSSARRAQPTAKSLNSFRVIGQHQHGLQTDFKYPWSASRVPQVARAPRSDGFPLAVRFQSSKRNIVIVNRIRLSRRLRFGSC